MNQRIFRRESACRSPFLISEQAGREDADTVNGIFDSHAHYFDKKFDTLEGGADALLAQWMPTPVERVINVGTNLRTSAAAVAMAARHEGMYAAVGIHPEDCHFLSDPEQALIELERLLGNATVRRVQKIVALGEIGLDYHWQSYGPEGEIPMDKGKQAFFFEAQLALAARMRLPVILHDREAHGDCFETVLRFPQVKGVFHSYSGSPEMARELCRRGWYISFSGSLTFKNAGRVREAAAAVPREQLLVETDAPYLAPHPLRGQLNHSGLLTYTLAVLAELWGCSPEEAAQRTSQNAEKLFLSRADC